MTRLKLAAAFAVLYVVASCAVTDERPSIEEWDRMERSRWRKFELVPQSQKWFEVYRVVPGIYAVYEPGHWEHVISYLVEGDDWALLFDTGLGIGRISDVCRELTTLPVTVVNSHSHYDHVGGNHEFSRIWARDTSFTNSSARGIPAEWASRFVPEESFQRDAPDGFDRASYKIHPYEVTRYLSDGEVIDLGTRKLEVLFTPGHAPDSICLLDREGRLLLTGDTFYLGPIFAQLRGSDLEDYHESARRIGVLEDDVDWLLPAHSPPMAEPKWLSRFASAFDSIADGSKPFTEERDPVGSGTVRIYSFGQFWVNAPKPQ